MSVIKLTDAKYAGLSTDIKPRDAQVGASFYEYDTDDLWDKTFDINNGNNGWVERPDPQGGGGSSSTTVKGDFTVKTVEGIDYMVLMAGNDSTLMEAGDLFVTKLDADRIGIGIIRTVPATDVSINNDIALQGKQSSLT